MKFSLLEPQKNFVIQNYMNHEFYQTTKLFSTLDTLEKRGWLMAVLVQGLINLLFFCCGAAPAGSAAASGSWKEKGELHACLPQFAILSFSCLATSCFGSCLTTHCTDHLTVLLSRNNMMQGGVLTRSERRRQQEQAKAAETAMSRAAELALAPAGKPSSRLRRRGQV